MARSSRLDSDTFRALPVLVIFFLLLKAYVVARYSLTTTGALVTAAPLTVLVGTVTSYLNITLVLIGASTSWWLVRSRRPRTDADRDIQPLAFGIAVVCLLFLPVPARVGSSTHRLLLVLGYALAVSVGALLAYRVTVALSARSRSGALRFLAERPAWYVSGFLVVLLLPTLRTPWVPAEVLVLRESVAISDSHPQHGRLQTSRYPVVYVLAENGEWTTALDARTRFLLRLPSAVIAYRQVCHYADQPPSSIPLFAYIGGVRYRSPNTVCSTLVRRHAVLLDPLVTTARRGA